jgi:hypothetical protein
MQRFLSSSVSLLSGPNLSLRSFLGRDEVGLDGLLVDEEVEGLGALEELDWLLVVGVEFFGVCLFRLEDPSRLAYSVRMRSLSSLLSQ